MSNRSPPEFEIRMNPAVGPAAVCDLRAAVGWDRLEDDYPAAFDGYWGTVGAFDSEQRLIGWCAILSDGVRHAILIDVIVHPDRRRQGIGRRLVAEAVSYARRRGVTILHVDFAPEHSEFYRRCGFRIGLGGIHDES
jgi:GNAT superfamily N-acetyltransferase